MAKKKKQTHDESHEPAGEMAEPSEFNEAAQVGSEYRKKTSKELSVARPDTSKSDYENHSKFDKFKREDKLS
jgi:hypothetical protein